MYTNKCFQTKILVEVIIKNSTMKDCEKWCQFWGQKEANFKDVSNYDVVLRVRIKIGKFPSWF